jgi:molybdate transport system substrate-binding protein
MGAFMTTRTITIVVAVLLLFAQRTQAQEVHVMTSGAFTAAFLEAAPAFEKVAGTKVSTAFGASMGGAPDSIPSRLNRGEPADVVILAREALDDLVAKGKVVRGSQVDLVRSAIGMAVRAGAPKPDISSVDALKRTLLAAKSIAYSASASGVYLSTELFPQLGIADAIKDKSRRIESERVGTVVARGDAEIGFQQVSELLPIPGLDYVGPLPEAVQRVTIFSAGIATNAKNVDAAKALIRYLSSDAVASTIRKTGLEPVR